MGLRRLRLIISLFFLSVLCHGCATAPRNDSLRAVRINGTSYVSVSDFCSRRAATLSYDRLTRVVTLSKSPHSASMVVRDSLAMIDGKPHQMGSAVELSDGLIYMPDSFRRDVLDGLFGDKAVSLMRGFGFGKVGKIVIDAGHGGKDPGAIGRSGLREKEVTLDIAKRLSALLNASGVETVMVRSTDKFVPLEERVRITNRSGASLFVSIHANANHARSLRGFEVYYLAPKVSDAERAMSSARSEKLEIDGSFYGNPSMALKALLWDMIHVYNRAEARVLSDSLCKITGCSLDTKIRGVKSANFHVLRGSSIPAVLVEVGFLSNPAEEARLKDGYYREKLARSIFDGILDYASVRYKQAGNKAVVLQ